MKNPYKELKNLIETYTKDVRYLKESLGKMEGDSKFIKRYFKDTYRDIESIRKSIYDLNHNSEIITANYTLYLKELDRRVNGCNGITIKVSDIKRHSPKTYEMMREHFYEEMKQNLKRIDKED